jgi:uncharacterized protein (TIGR02246 family)
LLEERAMMKTLPQGRKPGPKAAASAVIAVIFMASCLLLIPGYGRTDQATPTLEQLVHTLDADRQIRNLMSRYGQYLDSKNFEGYASLFAKDGEWSGNLSGYTTIKGPENIRAAMEKAFADRVYDPEHITNLHVITNIEINVDLSGNGDRATGYSRWTVLSRNESDQPYARVSGRYVDTFILEDGQWKILSRIARREIP